MKIALKTFVFYFAITMAVIACLLLLGRSILNTVFNAIVGEERGVLATNIFMQTVLPIITAIFTYVLKIKDSKARRNFLQDTQGKEYNAKADISHILHNKTYLIECIVFAAIYIFLALFGDPWLWMYTLYSVLFAAFNLWCWVHLRKKWHAERLRK